VARTPGRDEPTDSLLHAETSGAANDSLAGWLYLLRVPGVGSRSLLRLLERFGDPRQILAGSRADLASCGLRKASIDYLLARDWSSIEGDLRWLEQPQRHALSLLDPLYPRLLREIPDPPPVLFVHGRPDVLQHPQVAIVGSRNPSLSGNRTAYAFARFLASSGLTITSGLAVGIDAAAHRGALDAEAASSTIAVTGTGLDRVYPARNRELAQRIAGAGALVSEFPPGTPAKAEHFPRRNRLISGLCLGTLVVEAALHSGSLITARCALEQGREVFAIPGSVHNPLARGCHALIRQGAKLVETGSDIVEELGSLLGGLAQDALPKPRTAADPAQSDALDADYRQLLRAMAYDPVTVDQLVRDTGLTAEAVSSMLLLLELEGQVSSLPGGRYCRSAKC